MSRPLHHLVTPEILRKIRQAWEQEGLNNDKIMLWAAFLLAFYCFLRSGELCVAMGKAFHEHRDFTPQGIAIDNMSNPRMLKVHIKCLKTDPFKVGLDIFIARMKDDLCPVAAILAWLVKRGNASGPLFHFQTGHPLSCSTFVRCFKEALASANIDSSGFTGHSFRIEAATSAANRGMTDAQIKQLGRWKSDAYQRYIRLSPQLLTTLASSIASHSGHRQEQGSGRNQD